MSIFCGFSQNRAIDSLKQCIVQEEVEDTTKVRLNLNIAKEFLSIDVDSFSYYTKEAEKISLINDDFLLSKVYSNKGLTYVYKSQIDSAQYFLDNALKILDKKENKVIRASVFTNYALSYWNLDDFDKAIEYNLKAIKLIPTNYSEVSLFHYNQAILYGQSDLMNLYKKHMKLAYITSAKGNNNRAAGLAIKGLAHLAMEEKKMDSARIYLEEGLELCKKTESPQICYEINSKVHSML